MEEDGVINMKPVGHYWPQPTPWGYDPDDGL